MTTHPTDMIQWHRLIQGMPTWEQNSPEMAALVDDVRERGIDIPLIACKTQNGEETPGYLYLLDGRHRLKAAVAAGLETVPVMIRPEEEAVGIIFSSITQRRHFGKGALAYLLYPVMCASALPNGGNRSRQKAQSTESTVILDLCVRAGFSRDLYFQAKSLHESFARRADLRAEYEPRILSGEIGLGACLAGLAGKEATDGKSRQDRQPDQLLLEGFDILRSRFARWEKLETAQRRTIANQAADTILSLPAEVQEAVEKALRAARRLAA